MGFKIDLRLIPPTTGKKSVFFDQKTGDYVASPPMTGKIPFSAANTNDTSGFIPEYGEALVL